MLHMIVSQMTTKFKENKFDCQPSVTLQHFGSLGRHSGRIQSRNFHFEFVKFYKFTVFVFIIPSGDYPDSYRPDPYGISGTVGPGKKKNCVSLLDILNSKLKIHIVIKTV